MTRYRHLREMVLYLMIPAAGMFSPLLVIPAITSRFGSAGWTGMALAQSLGGSIGIAMEMGWGISGPQLVAGLNEKGRLEQYRLSITSRGLMMPLAVAAAATATALLVHEYVVPAAILAGAAATSAMTPAWYFLGIGQPLAILWSESVPKVLIASVSAAVIWLGGPYVTYSLLMCLTLPIALIVGGNLAGPDSWPKRSDWLAAPGVIRQQLVMGSGRAIQVIYSGLPVTFVQIAAPEATAVFAATERLTRMTLSVLFALPARLQNWIGSAEPAQRTHRIRVSVRLCAAMGLTAGVAYALLAPTVSRVIFTGAADLPYSVAAASGVLLGLLCVSVGLGLAMVATGQSNAITIAVIPSAIIAIGTIGVMAAWGGPVGAVLAEIAAEAAGTAMQCWFLWRHASKRSNTASVANAGRG